MRDPKSVAVTVSAPGAREIERRARAALGLQRSSTARRVSPAASVSSVSGVDAKKPRPSEARLVQAPWRHERGHARAEERAVLAVEVDAAASRERQPWRGLDVGLREEAGDVEDVGEPRYVARGERVAFVGDARHPRGRPAVPRRATSRRRCCGGPAR